MALFRSIVLVAALAGLIAGLFATAAQSVRIIPLILTAETYEDAAPAGHSHDQAGAATAIPAHEHGAWQPADGAERTLFTAMANILSGVGFALLLAAAFALGGGSDWRKGFYWGLAGFATFVLAPAIGLPPEVPGSAAAPLADRQIWWAGTVLATGAGLAFLFLSRKTQAMLAGVGLILLPHLIGAPQPAEHGGAAPASLAHEFVVAALVTGLLYWLVLGSVTGFLYKRFGVASAA